MLKLFAFTEPNSASGLLLKYPGVYGLTPLLWPREISSDQVLKVAVSFALTSGFNSSSVRCLL